VGPSLPYNDAANGAGAPGARLARPTVNCMELLEISALPKTVDVIRD
jgi:hypothetical protein